MTENHARPRIKWHTRQLGALERRGFKFLGEEKQFLRSALGDGLSFFLGPSSFEIAAVLGRFEELGLTDLLEPPPESEYEDHKTWDDKTWTRMWKHAGKEVDGITRICAAVGAEAASIETFGEDDPPPWREFGEREKRARPHTVKKRAPRQSACQKKQHQENA